MAALVVGGLDAQVSMDIDAVDVHQTRAEVRWTGYGTADQGLAVLVEGARGDEVASGGLVEALERSHDLRVAGRELSLLGEEAAAQEEAANRAVQQDVDGLDLG